MAASPWDRAKKNALRFDLARFVWWLGVIASPLTCVPQPALPSITMRWNYDPTNPPAAFTLLWGTNTIPAGTNLTATASNAPPGSHTFKAAALNAAGGATSAPVVVRVVRVNLETAPSPTGPWAGRVSIYEVFTVGPTNGFLRARLDVQ
jgi:hypothetical protein